MQAVQVLAEQDREGDGESQHQRPPPERLMQEHTHQGAEAVADQQVAGLGQGPDGVAEQQHTGGPERSEDQHVTALERQHPHQRQGDQGSKRCDAHLPQAKAQLMGTAQTPLLLNPPPHRRSIPCVPPTRPARKFTVRQRTKQSGANHNKRRPNNQTMAISQQVSQSLAPRRIQPENLIQPQRCQNLMVDLR